MSELRADRWWNLIGQPAFLASVRPNEASWRPLAALAVMIPLAVVLFLVGCLLGGVVNSGLNEALVLGQIPHWPSNPFAAIMTGLSPCDGCLMGGMATTVMTAMISGAGMIAVLTAATVVYRRPAKSWITGAPRFRWRLFLTGLALFSLALGAAYSVTDYSTPSGPAAAGFANRSDDQVSFTARLSHPFLKRGTWSVFYQYADNSSSQAGYTFESNQTGFELSYTF